MKLSRPLVVLDIEATGAWIEKDKIIEIAMIKVLPTGKKECFHKRINPKIPIPPRVVELTGIKNEDVKEAPVFANLAQEILNFIADADLGGFNCERFDLPLLERELSEAGYTFDWRKRKIFDAQKVFHYHEKRDLSAASQFFCGKELKEAHTAVADAAATLEILESQIKKYGNGEASIDALLQFDYTSLEEYYDEEKRFRWWNGKLYIMFGKYSRKLSLQELVVRDRPYLEWVLKADFSSEVKELIENALIGKFPVKDK